MKKFIYILGIILLNLLMAGVIFKINHWPGAAILIFVSIGLLVVVFFPLAITNSYQKQSNKKHMALHTVAYFTILIILAGALFKIMHWPGAGILMFIGIPLPFVLFFPMYLRFHKKTQKKYDLNFFGVIFFLLFLAVFSALLALQVSKNVLSGFALITDNNSALTQQIEMRFQDQYKAKVDSLKNEKQAEQIKQYLALGNQLDQTIEALKKDLALASDKKNKNVLEGTNRSWQEIRAKESSRGNYLMWNEENSRAEQLLKLYHAFMEKTKTISTSESSYTGKYPKPEDLQMPSEYSPENYIMNNHPGANLIANITVLSQWQQHIRYCQLEVLRAIQN